MQAAVVPDRLRHRHLTNTTPDATTGFLMLRSRRERSSRPGVAAAHWSRPSLSEETFCNWEFTGGRETAPMRFPLSSFHGGKSHLPHPALRSAIPPGGRGGREGEGMSSSRPCQEFPNTVQFFPPALLLPASARAGNIRCGR